MKLNFTAENLPFLKFISTKIFSIKYFIVIFISDNFFNWKKTNSLW